MFETIAVVLLDEEAVPDLVRAESFVERQVKALWVVITSRTISEPAEQRDTKGPRELSVAEYGTALRRSRRLLRARRGRRKWGLLFH